MRQDRPKDELIDRAPIVKRIAAISIAVFVLFTTAVIFGESGASHFELALLHLGPFTFHLPKMTWVIMREGLGWMGLFAAVLLAASAFIKHRRALIAVFAVLSTTMCLSGMLAVSSLAVLRPQAHDIRDQLLYYLGAKYYDEIGFELLNQCIIEAAMENDVAPPRVFMELGTNVVVDTDAYLARTPTCRNRFSTTRWDSLRKDLAGFTPGLIAWSGQWQRTLVDYGFNGTPVLRRIISASTHIFPATHRGLTLIALLNLLVMTVALYAVLAWVGPQEAVVCGLLLFVFPGDSFVHLWSIPRYFWFASLLVGVSLLYRGGKWAVPVAGALFAFSATLKAFPVTWMVGPALLALTAPFKRKRLDAAPSLLMGAGAAAVVLFLWSIADAHHLANWTEFAQRMRLNGNRLATGCIGFAFNFLQPVTGPNYNLIPRLHNLDAAIIGPVTLHHIQGLVQLLLSAVVARACLRLDCARASMLSGFALLFIWCVPVNYYYNAFLGLPLLFPRMRAVNTSVLFGAWLLIAAGVSGLLFERFHEAVVYANFLSTQFTVFLVCVLIALEWEYRIRFQATSSWQTKCDALS